MMNKENRNLWARWKVLLFIPPAALMTYAFARPEMNREIEQISTVNGYEILPVVQSAKRDTILRGGTWKEVEAYLNSEEVIAQRSNIQQAQQDNTPKTPTEEDWENAAAVLAQNSEPPQITSHQTPTEEDWEKAANEEIIIIPNVFKPDPKVEKDDDIPDSGDRNYLFFPTLPSPTSSYMLIIFNRFGELLYETNDTGKGWNGYYEGELCIEGVYCYVIEGVFQNGQPFKKMGCVALISDNQSNRSIK